MRIDRDALSGRVTLTDGAGDEWNTAVKTASALTATRGTFLLTNSLEAFEGDVRAFAKSCSKTIPRDHV